MKKLYILSIFLFTWTYADLSMTQIRNMVTKIHERREGIQLEVLENTKEPFLSKIVEKNVITLDTPKKEKLVKLSLHAILNKQAYINDGWQKVGDTIGGYTLKYIGKRGVVLQNENENEIKKLFLHKEKEDFIVVKAKEEI